MIFNDIAFGGLFKLKNDGDFVFLKTRKQVSVTNDYEFYIVDIYTGIVGVCHLDTEVVPINKATLEW